MGREKRHNERAHQDLLDETLKIWQPYSPEQITPDDLREIHENIVAFFSLLKEWDDKTGADDGSA